MKNVKMLMCLLVLGGCADSQLAVCGEGRDETVCFSRSELETVVLFDECLEHPEAGVSYNDHIIACGRVAAIEGGAESASDLWRKLLVLYSHADDHPEADDDFMSALEWVCENRTARCSVIDCSDIDCGRYAE